MFLLFSISGACGRAGQATKALELFQNMSDDGLAADRVAYNALFSALRVSEDPDKVSRKIIVERRHQIELEVGISWHATSIVGEFLSWIN